MMPKHPPYARIKKIPDGFEVSCETEHWDKQSFDAIQFSHVLQLLNRGERIMEEPDVFTLMCSKEKGEDKP